jgi:hypothetical protein
MSEKAKTAINKGRSAKQVLMDAAGDDERRKQATSLLYVLATEPTLPGSYQEEFTEALSLPKQSLQRQLAARAARHGS